MTQLATFLATAAYTGYFPIAPGTVGSAVGVAIFCTVRHLFPIYADSVGIAVTLVVGIWSAGIVERKLALKDPGPVVIDEVLGMWLTVAFLPVTLTGLVVGFVIFRIFDVIKPFPANRAERLPGGWGIMLDDAISGIYAQIVLRVLIFVVPGLIR
jgi:phosphatidylglycerophosphatase A